MVFEFCLEKKTELRFDKFMKKLGRRLPKR